VKAKKPCVALLLLVHSTQLLLSSLSHHWQLYALPSTSDIRTAKPVQLENSHQYRYRTSNFVIYIIAALSFFSEQLAFFVTLPTCLLPALPYQPFLVSVYNQYGSSRHGHWAPNAHTHLLDMVSRVKLEARPFSISFQLLMHLMSGAKSERKVLLYPSLPPLYSVPSFLSFLPGKATLPYRRGIKRRS
jgi:hypothetical protein